jgi:hypothetical protein
MGRWSARDNRVRLCFTSAASYILHCIRQYEKLATEAEIAACLGIASH